KPVEAAAIEPVKPPPQQQPAPEPVKAEPPKPAVTETRKPGKRRTVAEAEPAPAPQPPPQQSSPLVVVQKEPPPAPVVVVKETPPPPPPPPVIAKGELKLLIRPWAKIEVDDREVGVTPLEKPLILTAGEHKVRMVNPELGKDIVRTVHIKGNDTLTVKEILDE
ncbi:MAG TPA: hypothetical protein VH083_03590, partial [Myxococcales bacterium]|nr:hypothetical protein [Myxococcales bacterium]